MLVKIFKIIIGTVLFSNAYAGCIDADDDINNQKLSEKGNLVALINNKKGCVKFIEESKISVYQIKGYEKIHDINPNMDVHISADSRFAIIEYFVNESRKIIQIINVHDPSIIYEKSVLSAVWMEQENSILMVPGYEMHDLQTTYGLIKYSVTTKKEEVIANKYLFTGYVLIKGTKILASIMENNRNNFRLLYYDLSDNKEINLTK